MKMSFLIIFRALFKAGLIVCLAGSKLAAATYGKFTYVDNGTYITITGYPVYETGAIVIPATINGKPVTSIGDWAFHQCWALTSVTIPSSVTFIGDHAFEGCEYVTKITIPNSVTSIGAAAFNRCYHLDKVTIPNSVTSIGDWTFSSCISLTSVTIGSGVTSIGNYAFKSCYDLTNFTIPNNVISIGESAFESCGLTSVNIGSGVTSIGNGSFQACSRLTKFTVSTGNTHFSSNNGVLFNKNQTTLIQCPRGFTGTSYVIPDSVTSIRDLAFDDCSGLTSVIIPNSVTSIGNWAFVSCEKLTSLTIPNSVTAIGEGVFSGCSGLTSVTIPSGVTSIGDWAFRYCTGLTSVTMPPGVTFIGDSAFRDCSGLTKAIFLGNAPSLGGWGDTFKSVGSGFSVYYLNSKAGFTSPYWKNHPSIGIDEVLPEIAVKGTGGVGFIDGSSTETWGACLVNTSNIRTFTIQNSGTAALDNLNITRDGTNPGDFTVTQPALKSLPPGASITVMVNFKPTATGTLTATIHIASNDADENPFDIVLTGTGNVAPEIDVKDPGGISLTDGSSKVTWGSFLLNTSNIKIFKILNSGTAALNNLNITKSGTTAGDFNVTQPLLKTLAPGTSTTFTVNFKPTATGTRTAVIQIASNDANENPFDLVLTGQGIIVPEIVVKGPGGASLADGSSKVDWGSSLLNSSNIKTFRILNAGTATLKNLAIAKNGANPGQFAVTQPLAKSLAPGASTTFKVNFKPTATGTHTAAIHIASNDTDENPFDIVLTGKGKAPASSVSTIESGFATLIGAEPTSTADRLDAVTGVAWVDGRRYLAITVKKRAGGMDTNPRVEVSPNLLDWFSGIHYTTVMRDDAVWLKVRDNTPLEPGVNRYIRLK